MYIYLVHYTVIQYIAQKLNKVIAVSGKTKTETKMKIMKAKLTETKPKIGSKTKTKTKTNIYNAKLTKTKTKMKS